MTTQPPSHEEVQRSIAWHKSLLAGRQVADHSRIYALRTALEESDVMLESLLADNVRLEDKYSELLSRYNAKDERIVALEKDAADAVRYRGVMQLAQIVKVTSGQMLCLPQVRLYESMNGPDFRGNPDAAIDAVLNPAGQCSGTATGRDHPPT